MAINPPSDIVLDVARAADPETYRAAVERLARLRAAAPSDQAFIAPSAPAPAGQPTQTPPDAMVSSAAPAAGPRGGRLDPYKQFEAFVLQNFLESMLPKEATAVFGSGSAGEFWRSMLAEKLGGELARSGQVGIAQRLAKGPAASLQPSTVGSVHVPMNATLVAGHAQNPTTIAPATVEENGVRTPNANERS